MSAAMALLNKRNGRLPSGWLGEGGGGVLGVLAVLITIYTALTGGIKI